ARSTLAAAGYRPGAVVGKIELPVLFVVCEDDLTTPASSTMAVAPRARRGEVLLVPGGHYAPFLEAHEEVVAAELDFLDRHLGHPAKPLAGNVFEKRGAGCPGQPGPAGSPASAAHMRASQTHSDPVGGCRE